jgi:nitrogen fixation-related uncharacterized protein
MTLAFASLCLAVALPIGALAAASRADSGIALLVAVSAMVLVAVLAFLAATKKRAGVPIGRGGLALPTLVSAGLIVAAYAGTAFVWDALHGPYDDMFGEDELYALGATAGATFIIVYTTLSMARR